MSAPEAGGAPFDEACALCGSTTNLVEDPLVPGLLYCRECLDRVAVQEEMIREGLEDEPEVES